MGSLTAPDAEKLAKTLSLLASDKVGEVAAAANMATQFLRTRDLRWADLLQPALPPPKPKPRLREKQLAILGRVVQRLQTAGCRI